MSELIGRMAFESEFLKRMVSVQGTLRKRLTDLLGNPPDWRRVPVSFWAEAKAAVEQDALLAILLITASSAQQHGIDVPPQPDARLQYEAVARDPRIVQAAQQQAAKVAQSWVDTSVESLRRNADPARPQSPAEMDATAEDVADVVLPNSRAENLAITETTGARQAGANIAMQGRESSRDRWRTEADSAVCPICAPLHNTLRPVWSAKFPSGPPAHPRCRCDIVFEAESGGGPTAPQPPQPGPAPAAPQPPIPQAPRQLTSAPNIKPSAAVLLDGRVFDKGRADRRDALVVLDPRELDAAWQRYGDATSYIGPTDPGIANRRENFRAYLQTGKPIEASRINLTPSKYAELTRIDFRDGRHRFAVLRDAGSQRVAVTLPAKQFDLLRQLVPSAQKVG